MIIDHANDKETFSTQFLTIWILSGINCFMVLGVIVKHKNAKRDYENGDYYYHQKFLKAMSQLDAQQEASRITNVQQKSQ